MESSVDQALTDPISTGCKDRVIRQRRALMVSHPQVFDDSAVRRELGYQPIITVEEGMVDLTTRTRTAGRSHW